MAKFRIYNDPADGVNPAPLNVTQARPDSGDFEILGALANGVGVQSGCTVTAHGGTMAVDVAAGVAIPVASAGPVTVAATANIAVTAADGTNPRRDLITVNSSGTVVYTAGTPAAIPCLPVIPASSCVLAVLDVPVGTTAIVANSISDRAPIVGQGVQGIPVTGTAGIGKVVMATGAAAAAWTQGNFTWNLVQITDANATASNGDFTEVSALTANRTLTVPTSPAAGYVTGGRLVSITTAGSTWTVTDGTTTYAVLTVAGQDWVMYYNGTTWAFRTFPTRQGQTFTGAGTFTAGLAGTYMVAGCGGGGGGGGGGTGHATTQVGGGGGAAAAIGRQYVTLTAGQTLAVSIGAGGTAGTGGAAGSNPGAVGVKGGDSTVISTSPAWTITFTGAASGAGGAATSAATVQAGIWGSGIRGTPAVTAGSGGTATSTGGNNGGGPIDLAAGGGGGGSNASATLGGAAGTPGTMSGYAAGGSGQVGAGLTGATASDAASTSYGAGGGGGGGGGPTTGVGGAGGKGGPGIVVIQQVG